MKTKVFRHKKAQRKWMFCSMKAHVQFMRSIKLETFLGGLIQRSTRKMIKFCLRVAYYRPFLLIHVFSKVLSVSGTNVSRPRCDSCCQILANPASSDANEDTHQKHRTSVAFAWWTIICAMCVKLSTATHFSAEGAMSGGVEGDVRQWPALERKKTDLLCFPTCLQTSQFKF